MLQSNTSKFISSLSKHNNKPWFDEHREDYLAAKEDFENFIALLLKDLAKIEPAFAEQQPKDCIYRIYRDVRFSKDKTPYKSHFGAFFNKAGKKSPSAGYYLHIEPGKCFAGGGLWMPEAALLKAVRQEIDYNFDEFQQIVGNKKFVKLFNIIRGEQLKTLPKGYEANNPAIEYLKMKSFIVDHAIDDKDVSGKAFLKTCMDTFTAMKPLVDFLNRGVD
jgi:uncharacterized protein (TIGR02453 family)